MEHHETPPAREGIRPVAVPKYLTVEEIAGLTGFTPHYLRQVIASGELQGNRPKPAGPWRVREDRVVAWIEREQSGQPRLAG
jgi:excisionase family DNA binding protein